MLAYLNGQLIPHAEATIPVWDYGFTMGVTVTEQLRTYNGKLFFLQQHLERLTDGLNITKIDPGVTIDEIGSIAEELVLKNLAGLPAGQELGVGICVTPGTQCNRAPAEISSSSRPTLLVYSTALDSSKWQHDYETGIRMVTVDIREIPDECLPRGLKCRSRMHYYLAEQQAQIRSPGSRALLLDTQGFMAEGTTASVVIVRDGCLIAPRPERVLPGISWSFVENVLAGELGMEVRRADITLSEVHRSDEVLALSTSSCIVPVCEVNGTPIGAPDQRPVFHQLIDAWSVKVGVALRG